MTLLNVVLLNKIIMYVIKKKVMFDYTLYISFEASLLVQTYRVIQLWLRHYTYIGALYINKLQAFLAQTNQLT